MKFKNPESAVEAARPRETDSKGKEKEQNAEKEEQELESTKTTEGANGEEEEVTKSSESGQSASEETGKSQVYPRYPFREQATFPDVELVRYGEIQHLQRFVRIAAAITAWTMSLSILFNGGYLCAR